MACRRGGAESHHHVLHAASAPSFRRECLQRLRRAMKMSLGHLISTGNPVRTECLASATLLASVKSERTGRPRPTRGRRMMDT